MFPTIEDNFTTLLRAGAFEITGTRLLPMSDFKWRRLLDAATELGVTGVISSGARVMADDPNLPVWIDKNKREERFDTTNAHLFNFLKNSHFHSIIEEERHSIDTSTETLEFLKLLIANSDEIVSDDMKLIGIISVGHYLRNKGNRIDFIKLNNWIERLNIKQLASFQASILIDLFDFEPNELDFFKQKYINSMKHYNAILHSVLREKHRFKYISRLNIALVETASLHIGRITSYFLNVEE